MPRVSIGLPVFNAEKYLNSSLDSLLSQDYQDFELIISDNASTDSTKNICMEYLKNDKRIRFIENETNMGAVKNFTKVLEEAKCEYFMWTSHDDLWDSSFLSKCVNMLDKNPDAILCNTGIVYINRDDQVIKIKGNFYGSPGIDTTGLDIVSRFRKVMLLHCGPEIYGLNRTNILKKFLPISEMNGCESILLAKMAIEGIFVRIPELLFQYRYSPKTTPEKMITVTSTFDKELYENIYTTIAKRIIQVVNETGIQEKYKNKMIDDFVTIITSAHKEWAEKIFLEHKIKPENPFVYLKNLLAG